LFISRRTVETHRQRIMKKLATHSIVDMIRLAAREGALSE
jgi:DNA-binding CsgD family transcriptional regulator